MDIIISRYEKDVKWSEQFKDSHRIFIYDKSNENNNFIKLPNIGREPHTFLYHIIEHYDNLPNFSCFLQDDPFDHLGNKDISFIGDVDKYWGNINFYPIGYNLLHWNYNGGPHYSMLEIKKLLWDKYFINYPQKLDFIMGGQFIVNKKMIHLRKKIFYEMFLEEINRNDIPIDYKNHVVFGPHKGPNQGKNKFPWILESSWSYIFNENYKSKYDN
jgi:hypothetical protein